MPLFKHSAPPAPQPVVEERRTGLFGRKKNVLVDPNTGKTIASPTSPTNKLSSSSPTHATSPVTGSSHVSRLNEINTAIPAAYVD